MPTYICGICRRDPCECPQVRYDMEARRWYPATTTGRLVLRAPQNPPSPEPTPRVDKICAECVHCEVTNSGADFVCNKTYGTYIDLVTGQTRVIRAVGMDIYWHRDAAAPEDFATYHFERCGPDGIHWEAKPVERALANIPHDWDYIRDHCTRCGVLIIEVEDGNAPLSCIGTRQRNFNA